MEGRSSIPEPRAAPVKRAPWEPYLPLYFWLGGVAAGGWLAAAAEDWAGAGERDVVRAGRYLALGGVLAGSAVLIVDLGRPERFHHMLRFVQPRSAMSLGSWGLAAFGAAAGGGAVLQFIEDRLGTDSALARLSCGPTGRALNLVALPLALFLGSYTGTLLASTSTPTWARRRLTLPVLFLASSAASGLTATAAIIETGSSASTAARRRLARASTAALAAELVLTLADDLQGAPLPSHRREPATARAARSLSLLAGTVAPLILTALHARRLARRGPGITGRPRGPRAGRALMERPGRATAPFLAAALALGGSLMLRFRVTREGYHSADTAADTWEWARVRAAPGRAAV
jgi:formate-dependent nitrite reductase membrane component NrfD